LFEDPIDLDGSEDLKAVFDDGRAFGAVVVD
jgi:hypothetical protein